MVWVQDSILLLDNLKQLKTTDTWGINSMVIFSIHVLSLHGQI